jgi:hypothetical protein
MNQHPSSEGIAPSSSEGMASNGTALLYNWLLEHRNNNKSGRKSACLQLSRRVSQESKSPECLVTGTQRHNYHYKPCPSGTSMSRAMSTISSSKHQHLSYLISSLNVSTSMFPYTRRGIRGRHVGYVPADRICPLRLRRNLHQHKAISTLQTMSQWPVQDSSPSNPAILTFRFGRCCRRDPRPI